LDKKTEYKGILNAEQLNAQTLTMLKLNLKIPGSIETGLFSAFFVRRFNLITFLLAISHSSKGSLKCVLGLI
jgi:hypothetical protein